MTPPFHIYFFSVIHHTSSPSSYLEVDPMTSWNDIKMKECLQMTFVVGSKKMSNDQELIQSDPTFRPQNQKGNS